MNPRTTKNQTLKSSVAFGKMMSADPASIFSTLMERRKSRGRSMEGEEVVHECELLRGILSG